MRPRIPVIRTADWERNVAGAVNHLLSESEKQQAAIADHASDATVNAILAALRAQGIIAP